MKCLCDVSLSEIMFNNQGELFLSEVNNRETIAAIEVNKDTYFLQKRIEKFPLF